MTRRHKPIRNKILYATDDPFLRDPSEHNYMKKIAQATARGELDGLGIFSTNVYHDDWCRIYDGLPCNCNCEVIVETPDGRKKKL